MPTADATSEIVIAVDIPAGYRGLPLTDIDDAIDKAKALFASLGPGSLSSEAPAVLQTLEFALTRLAQLNTVYCGLGRHLSADGRQISSTLTLTVSEYGEQTNPRLTLGNVLTGRLGAGEKYANAEFVEISDQLVLLLDRVRSLPVPPRPDRDDVEPVQSVYQIEAVVASPDGSAIAMVELSTPFIEHGEEYLLPVARMAASIRFAVTPLRSTTSFSLDL